MKTTDKKRALGGIVFLLIEKVLKNFIQIITIAILARKLEPTEFGVVAIAQVVFRFVSVLSMGGVGTYIIYETKNNKFINKLNAAFWLNITLTIVYIIIVMVVTPFVALFYSEEVLRPIIYVLLIGFIFDQLKYVPESIIKKNIEHSKLAKREIVIRLLVSILSVTFALNGYGVWALVLPPVLIKPLSLFITMYIAKWRPCLKFHFKYWLKIFKYSITVTGTNILGVVLNEGDTLIIGKYIGKFNLGLYDLSWRLSNFFGKYLTSIVSDIAFTSLATVKDDLKKLRSIFSQVVELIAFVSFPLIVFMGITANQTILLFYGTKWLLVVPYFRIMLAFTLIKSITSPVTAIFNVCGKPKIGLIFNLIFLPIYLIAIVVGIRWGILGVTIAVTLIRSLGAIYVFNIALKMINLRIKKVLYTLMPIIIASLSMSLFVSIQYNMMNRIVNNDLLLFIYLSLIALLTYLLIMLIISKQSLVKIINLVDHAIPNVNIKRNLILQKILY